MATAAAAWMPCRASAPNAGFARIETLSQFTVSSASVQTPSLTILRADYHLPRFNASVHGLALRFKEGSVCQRGIGAHAESVIRLHSPRPVSAFSARIGVDDNPVKESGRGRVVFKITAGGKEVFKSPVLTGDDASVPVSVDMKQAHSVDFIIANAGENPSKNNADWGQAQLVFADQSRLFLDEIPLAEETPPYRSLPFSFQYAGQSSDILLAQWPHRRTIRQEEDADLLSDTWESPDGVSIRVQSRRFKDFPALEWLLWLENKGDKNSDVFKEICPADIELGNALNLAAGRQKIRRGFFVQHTRGDFGMHNPAHFSARRCEVDCETVLQIGRDKKARGRSSQNDLPFFRIDRKNGAVILGIGWSGQWFCDMKMRGSALNVKAGVSGCEFYLKPGEKVRLARMLLLDWEGEPAEANAQFRKLLAKHFLARMGNAATPREPIVWANTWAIGGQPLNQTSEGSNLALIKKFGKLSGVDYFVTDAGWYGEGFNISDGDYVPNAQRFPNGIEPLCAAARQAHMRYGLWFDAEKVFSSTNFAKAHPEQLLSLSPQQRDLKNGKAVFLRDLGNPHARETLWKTLRPYLETEGFGFYRQDFNADPLVYWERADEASAGRKGIAQIKYIMGLYAYWDRIAERFPDIVREECASGGRRIDLETLMRMHVHQKSDFHSDPQADQSSLWGLSQYIPNAAIATLPKTTDLYDFCSLLPSSLALGWPVYRENFDWAAAQKLLDLHRRLKHLFSDSWYPLAPQSLDSSQWSASQYHRDDLEEGVVIALRCADSPYASLEVNLHKIDPLATYRLTDELTGKTQTISGAQLQKGFVIAIAQKRAPCIWRYQKCASASSAQKSAQAPVP